MLFSSIPFLYYFLPAVLIFYFIVPAFLKNAVLLLFSLLFYAWGEPRYVLIMLAVTLVGYISGLLLDAFRKEGDQASNRTDLVRKVILFVSVLLCGSGLLYFKYTDFFLTNVNYLPGISIPLLKLSLPIGISFYTFQIISYVVDVYRGDVKAQKNPIYLATYVALFAQLIAGPIVRYRDIALQLEGRTHSFDLVFDGITRFMIGLSKKILLANVLGEVATTFRSTTEPSVGFYWLYVVAYALHLYFDFSGYSDMAIGLGKIFGFTFPENFNYPFISASATEFWRRWHMSLGSWFRDYVYIPLGGNRVSKAKWFRNLFVVWMLTGFWHGAAWNYIFWGLLFAVLLMLEKAGFLKVLDKHKIFSHVYMILVILLSFALFNAADMSQFFGDVKGLFGLAGLPVWSVQTGYYLRSYGVVLLIAMVGATPLPAKLVGGLKKLVMNRPNRSSVESERQKKTGTAGAVVWGGLEVLFLLGLLVICTAFLVDGSFNPFLYFRF